MATISRNNTMETECPFPLAYELDVGKITERGG